MVQQIEFPKLPGTEADNYQPVITGLLAYVDREKPTDKDLRQYMRARSLYEKEGSAQLLEFIGIREGKTISASLNEFGKKLLDTDDPTEWKKILFFEIARRNQILIKFVFDALFERLYSVNEMYRGVTSYAYPGKNLTLPSFKNWMTWVQGCGMVKYIGIRWGPSELAKNIEDYFRGLDIEEILEEESVAPSDAGEAEESAQAEGSSAEVASSDGEQVFEEVIEEVPDLPPEAPGQTPALEPVSSSPAPQRAVREAPVASAPPAHMSAEPMDRPDFPVYRSVLTLRTVAEIREVQKVLELDPEGAELARRSSDLDDAEIAANLEGLRDLWKTAQNKQPFGFSDLGLAEDQYDKQGRKKNQRGLFVYRALVAATCIHRPVLTAGSSTGPAPTAISRFKALEDSGALTRHFEKKASLDNVITGLAEAGYAERVDVLSMAPYMVLAKQALMDGDEWIAKLEEPAPEENPWDSLYQHLHVGVFSIELIWLGREMARHGLWNAEALKTIGVVPSQDVLDIAFRIGLLPSPYLANFAAALSFSRSLTAFVGAEYGFEASLQYFGKQLGCSYDCPRRHGCSYYCREKLRR